ncbi:MAG TPA: family 16 glycosylhydrolase [Amycolatopsis sp.]|uniref:family 16 glycosylhydrolase n=1 Tax=Amycolatopsis sp. TaxID=37632 RepID=UPI002B4637FA|nr:family 16 glycosylhydrolase [Amycolatopsis sp.]HKS45685.1 family 16 glycosylhydrolase [Amycolatopsis sp.]
MIALAHSRRRSRLLGIAIGTLLGALATSSCALPSPHTPTASAGGMTLTWSDEFDGPAGSPPSPDRWRAETGGGGWGNRELEYYTGGTANAALDGDGRLIISARDDDASGYPCWYGACRYTSGRLTTAGKFAQEYGRFEIRARVPAGQGLWPALWMLGAEGGNYPRNGEIDIAEVIGGGEDTQHMSLHGPGVDLTGNYALPAGQSLADGDHTYAIDWGPSGVVWSLDGRAVQNLTESDIGGGAGIFDHPFYVMINLAVGGNWPGPPGASTRFPAQLQVDYVRVYRGPPANLAGRITGADGRCVDGGPATDGKGSVELRDCAGNSAQTWTVGSGGAISALGECLDGSGGTGATVGLRACGGVDAQRWRVDSSGRLVNARTGDCLTGPEPNTDVAALLWLRACTPDATQRWKVVTPDS